MAACESVQDSTGFSPVELVFGYTVRGPLHLLREKNMSKTTSPSSDVLSYVSNFRERLHKACEATCMALSTAQGKMKQKFDKKSVRRDFQVGEEVLALLPITGSALQGKFCGPYVVEKQLSDTDYVLCTPDHCRKTRACLLTCVT